MYRSNRIHNCTLDQFYNEFAIYVADSAVSLFDDEMSATSD